MRTEWRHEYSVKHYGVITAAVIVGGATLYAADQAAKAQEEAQKKIDEAKRIEDARLAQIAADTKPQEEGATVEFGTEDTGEGTGDYTDFLVGSETTTSHLGSTDGSGLASTNLSTLAI